MFRWLEGTNLCLEKADPSAIRRARGPLGDPVAPALRACKWCGRPLCAVPLDGRRVVRAGGEPSDAKWVGAQSCGRASSLLQLGNSPAPRLTVSQAHSLARLRCSWCLPMLFRAYRHQKGKPKRPQRWRMASFSARNQLGLGGEGTSVIRTNSAPSLRLKTVALAPFAVGTAYRALKTISLPSTRIFMQRTNHQSWSQRSCPGRTCA